MNLIDVIRNSELEIEKSGSTFQVIDKEFDYFSQESKNVVIFSGSAADCLAYIVFVESDKIDPDE